MTADGDEAPASAGTAGVLGDEAPRDSGPRILFLGGTGRNGSTLVGAMLGQVPGFVNVGEARYVWEKALIGNRLCGCGSRFRDCPFWSEVAEQAFGGWRAVDAEAMELMRTTVDHPSRFPALLMPKTWSGFDAKVRDYVEVLDRLYRAIQAVSGASVIVDSSRFPSYALLLTRMPRADVRLVHLARDSRGVAFSWQKKVAVSDSPDRTIYLPTYSSFAGSARYDAYNLQTWLLRLTRMPYLFMRYEDVVADPVPHLERMLDHAGAGDRREALTFLDEGSMTLATMHTVMGNPVRMESGSVKVRLDEEWRAGMARRERLVVTATTLPLLVWYRYLLPRTRPAGGSGDRIETIVDGEH